MSSNKDIKKDERSSSTVDNFLYPKSQYTNTRELDLYTEYTPQKVDTSLIHPEPLFEDNSQSNMFSSNFKNMGTADGNSTTLPDWLI